MYVFVVKLIKHGDDGVFISRDELFKVFTSDSNINVAQFTEKNEPYLNIFYSDKKKLDEAFVKINNIKEKIIETIVLEHPTDKLVETKMPKFFKAKISRLSQFLRILEYINEHHELYNFHVMYYHGIITNRLRKNKVICKISHIHSVSDFHNFFVSYPIAFV